MPEGGGRGESLKGREFAEEGAVEGTEVGSRCGWELGHG